MTATTTIEVDSTLVTRLKEDPPVKDPHTLLEALARVKLASRTLDEVPRRSALGEREAG